MGKNSKKYKIFHLYRERTFFLFISPWLIGFLVLTLYPMCYSLFAAFTRWDGITEPIWTGWNNFENLLFNDSAFWIGVKNTFVYTFISVPLNLCIAFILAVLVNKKLFASNFFRSVFYMPTIISGVAIFMAWGYILDPASGIMNYFLSLLGIPGPGWLTTEGGAMPSIIFMQVYNLGTPLIIVLAGLQGVPRMYYEAARIDGASSLRQFWHITIPMMSPVIFYNMVMQIILALQVFMVPWVMTEGGPNKAIYTMNIHLYSNAFRYSRFGYASAIAWVLFLIILVFSILVFRFSKYWVFYQED